LAIAASTPVIAGVAAPGFSKDVTLVSVVAPGKPRLVRARAVVGEAMFAEAARILGARCRTVKRVLQLQDDPLGPQVIVYKADCDTGTFQVSLIDTRSYVKPWTGVLRD
jgi:hypothetical protein